MIARIGFRSLIPSGGFSLLFPPQEAGEISAAWRQLRLSIKFNL